MLTVHYARGPLPGGLVDRNIVFRLSCVVIKSCLKGLAPDQVDRFPRFELNAQREGGISYRDPIIAREGNETQLQFLGQIVAKVVRGGATGKQTSLTRALPCLFRRRSGLEDRDGTVEFLGPHAWKGEQPAGW